LTDSPPPKSSQYPALFIPDQTISTPDERVFITNTALTQSRRTTYPSPKAIIRAHTRSIAAEATRRQGFIPKKKPIIIQQSSVVRQPDGLSSMPLVHVKKSAISASLPVKLDIYLAETYLDEFKIEDFVDMKNLSKFSLL
jgi:hypothetical protein